MSPNAMGLARVLGVLALSAQAVLSVADGFKVLRVYAGTHSAQMVDLNSLWNRTDPKFIRDAVRVAVAQSPVPVRVKRTLPDPAFVLRQNSDAIPKVVPHAHFTFSPSNPYRWRYH